MGSDETTGMGGKHPNMSNPKCDVSIPAENLCGDLACRGKKGNRTALNTLVSLSVSSRKVVVKVDRPSASGNKTEMFHHIVDPNDDGLPVLSPDKKSSCERAKGEPNKSKTPDDCFGNHDVRDTSFNHREKETNIESVEKSEPPGVIGERVEPIAIYKIEKLIRCRTTRPPR